MRDHQSQIREEFSRQADAMAVATIFTDAQILSRIRDAAHLTPCARVLDVACGPGLVAEALAPDAGTVVAVDLTPTMLHRTRSRCQAAGLPHVHCALSQAETLPFDDGAFDAVVVRSALHHFPYPAAALAEMARVLHDAGRLVIVDVVSSEEPEESSLHNALEVLRDPSHIRMLPQSEIGAMLREVGLDMAPPVMWTNRREFDEWLRITNAPERIAPLYAVMSALAKSGVRAGIDLRLEDEQVVFEHRSLLITATKP